MVNRDAGSPCTSTARHANIAWLMYAVSNIGDQWQFTAMSRDRALSQQCLRKRIHHDHNTRHLAFLEQPGRWSLVHPLEGCGVCKLPVMKTALSSL